MMLAPRPHSAEEQPGALPQLDYVALGHIHKRQVLGEDPPVVYAGSLQSASTSARRRTTRGSTCWT